MKPDTLFIPVWAWLLLVAACTPDKVPSPTVDETPAPSAKPSTSADKALPNVSGKTPAAPTLPETIVFGIKIPTGMRPAMGPDKVYRFEGKPTLAQVKMLIEDQIEAGQKLREVEGWLYRNAKAKDTDAAPDAKPLAIRMWGKENGSVLDIWVEQHYADALPNRAETKSNYTFKSLGRPTRVSGLPKPMVEKRRKSLGETMRIMKKVEKGEPLTKEELSSDLFY